MVCGERSLHLLLRDLLGHRCEAITEPYLVSGFDPVFVVGSLFHIIRFSLIKNVCSYPPLDTKFMIMFHSHSSVVSTVAYVFSTCLYDVTDISIIKEIKYHIDPFLFDVFGGVVDYQELPRDVDGSGRMVLLLEDNTGSEIRVVLKDQYYHDFKCCIDVTRRRRGCFYVVLQLFHSALFNGEVVLTSYKDVSKIITDQTNDRVIYFKSRLTRLIRCARTVGERLMLFSGNVIKEELGAPGVHFLSLSEIKVTSIVGGIWVVGWIHYVFRFRD